MGAIRPAHQEGGWGMSDADYANMMIVLRRIEKLLEKVAQELAKANNVRNQE